MLLWLNGRTLGSLGAAADVGKKTAIVDLANNLLPQQRNFLLALGAGMLPIVPKARKSFAVLGEVKFSGLPYQGRC